MAPAVVPGQANFAKWGLQCYQIAFSENCRIHFSKLEIIRCPWWKYTLRQWPGRLPHSKLSFAQAAPAHFLTQHPLFGGSPKSATFANIKGWGSTNSPLHPRPLSNIKLVNKAFTSQFACAESLNFELFVAFFLIFWLWNVKSSPVWTCHKVIGTSFHKETIFNPPLKYLRGWQSHFVQTLKINWSRKASWPFSPKLSPASFKSRSYWCVAW